MSKVEIYFEKLIQLFQEENYLFCNELLHFCHKKDKEHLNLFVNILQTRNVFFDIFEKLVKVEILSSHDVFLRGDTIATQMLRLLQDAHARQYYTQYLKKSIDSLMRLKFNLEILNNAEAEEEELQKLSKRVMKKFGKIFNEICSIPVPPTTAMACYCISKVIEEAETKELIKAFEVKGEDQLAVGLTLFLYTICPIFITDFADITSLGYRNLVLIAKILLALASGTNFEQPQYKYFSAILDQHRQNYLNFSMNIISTAKQLKPFFVSPNPTPFSYWKKFYGFLKKYENEIVEMNGNLIIGGSTLREKLREGLDDVEQKKKGVPIGTTQSRRNSLGVVPSSSPATDKKLLTVSKSLSRSVSDNPQDKKKKNEKVKVKEKEKEKEKGKKNSGGLYRY